MYSDGVLAYGFKSYCFLFVLRQYCCVAYTGLKLLAILLSQDPGWWDYRLICSVLFKNFSGVRSYLFLLLGILLFFKKKFIYLFNECKHTVTLQTHQKRASDPITNGCEPPCGCWELNSGPLEEQPVSALNHWAISPALFFFLRFKL